MRLSRWIPLAFLASGLVGSVRSAAAQQVCSGGQGNFHCWASWSGGNLWRNHPFAHGVGGVGTELFAYGPWFSGGVRKHLGGRLAVTVALTAAWELELKKELPHYQWSYAAYDMGAAVTSALLTEGLLTLVRKL